MNFCTNCGNKLNGTKFCTKCGAKVEVMLEDTSFENDPASVTPKSNKIVPVIAILAVIAFAVSGFFMFSGRSYKSLIKTYVNASMKGDAKKLVSLLPEGRVQAMIDDWYDDKKAIIEDIQEELDDYLAQIENKLGNDYHISYEIVDERDYKGSELAEFKKDYLNEYNTKISAAKESTVNLTVSAKGKENSEHASFTGTAVKIGRSWYISGFDE